MFLAFFKVEIKLKPVCSFQPLLSVLVGKAFLFITQFLQFKPLSVFPKLISHPAWLDIFVSLIGPSC